MKALVIEKNEQVVRDIENVVDTLSLTSSTVDSPVELKHVESLSRGLKLLDEISFDVVFSNLDSSANGDKELLSKIKSRANDAPILILCDKQQEKRAVLSVGNGAQDYIIKDQVDKYNLLHILTSSIQREKYQKQLLKQENQTKDSGLEKKNELDDIKKRLHLEISERKVVEEALRESSRRFKSIAMSLAGWIWEIDENGVYTYCSEKVFDILGYTEDEMIGKSFFDFLNSDKSKNVVETFFDATIGQDGFKDLECWYIHKNGDHVCLLCNGIHIIDSHGNFTGYQGVNKNITDRKIAEENLNALNRELERSNHELEQYAYVASHDLQEPLRMVSSYVQLLSKRYKGNLDSDADEFIDFAVNGSLRMEKLIKDLLTYSRVSSKKKPFELTDLNLVLDRVLSDLRLKIEESHAVITCDPLPTLLVEPTQIGQLFQNLISNAIKFQSDKRPEISIHVAKENNHWEFSIKDNGIGISEEFYDRIFIIFQRLHRNEEYSGTGIGLSICKKIVELHHGRIWVESQSGKGTAFKFTVPSKRQVAHV